MKKRRLLSKGFATLLALLAGSLGSTGVASAASSISGEAFGVSVNASSPA